MATVHPELAGTVQAEQIDGAVVGMQRTFRVTGLTQRDAGYGYLNLSEAADAVTASGYPGTTVGSLLGSFNNLVLSKVSPKIHNDDATVADVTLEYIPISSAANYPVFQGRSSLRQVTTEKDGYGNQILLEHTFPDDDVDFGLNTTFNPSDVTPKAVLQGGEIALLMPSAEQEITIFYSTDYPMDYCLSWLGHINWYSWGSAAPFTWICSDVSYTIHNLATSPPVWKFQFQFQYDPLGWPKNAIFVDPRTGKPPQNLVPGEGIQEVFWYPYADFNLIGT